MRTLMRLPCAALFLLGSSLLEPLRAQVKQACDQYITDAVRVEPGGFMAARKLVRASSGHEVLKIRSRTRELEQYFVRSDSAVSYAIDYGRHQRRSSVLMALAWGTSFVLPLVVDFDDGKNSELRWGSYGVSFGVGLLGQAQQRRAERSLARAVWHYNSTIHAAAVAGCGAQDSAANRSNE